MVLQLSSRAKARLAVVALAALLVWPLAHYRLVETYRLNAWKFFGFAMYCRPTLPVALDAFLVIDGKHVAYPPETWPVDGQRVLAAFGQRRQLLGTRMPPTPVASWIFLVRPAADELVLVVRHVGIDRKTGLIVETEFPYDYQRPRRARNPG